MELIALIREYIDVFAWSYEDMPDVDLQIAMHYLNIKLDAKPVKQQQQQFRPDIMKAIEAKIYKLIECGFIREEHNPDWVANIVPFLRRMEKSESVLTIVILMQPVLKTSSHCPSLTSDWQHL